MDNIEKIWSFYCKSKDAELRKKLILYYAHIVKYVAGRISTHIYQYIDFDDLVGYGIFGLIDAIDKYDISKGVKFETYASLRIRGAIFDSIRKLDWVPRSIRQKHKALEDVFAELETRLKRAPTDEEVSAALDMPVEAVREMIRSSSITSLVSLDDFLDQNFEINSNSIKACESSMPDLQYEQQELKQMLSDAINSLSDKEKKVITLYYFEELTLKEISLILNVSESRVSQIHSRAVFRLQFKLGRFKSILFSV